MIARTARRQYHGKNLHRGKTLWLAAMLHRLSGLGLAIFLPVHFLTLGVAITGEAQFENVLGWSEVLAVKIGEAVLIFFLVIHALGGLRLLAIENLAWQDGQQRLAMLATAIAAAIAVMFLAWAL